ALFIGDSREWCPFGDRNHSETWRKAGNVVAMAHPDLIPRPLGPDALEQRAVIDHLDFGAAKLPTRTRFHLAPKLGNDGVLAIADAEHRQTCAEDDIRRGGRIPLVHACRAAGENDRFRLKPLKPLLGFIERKDLAVHAGLAHAPRNELRKLGAEIENED